MKNFIFQEWANKNFKSSNKMQKLNYSCMTSKELNILKINNFPFLGQLTETTFVCF